MKKKLPALITVLLLLVLWEAGAWVAGRPEIFPPVHRLLMALGELFFSDSFYQSVGTTLLRGLTGILISSVLACGFAVLFSRRRWLHEAFRPLLVIMRSIPVVSFILLALIYFHAESIPLIIAFLVMFPLLTENITKGILQLNPGYKAMAQVFLISGRNRLFHVYYPQLNPFLFSGLASAMGFGWRAIIMGEVLSQCDFGIGSEMKRAQVFIDVPELMAWTLVAILISFGFDKAISRLERWKIPLTWCKNQKAISLTPSAVHLENISFSYPDKQIFSGFNYTFNANAIYGISAPSGAGKTTLLYIINNVLTPQGGKVETNRSRGMATVFQEPELLPHLTVMENALLPLTSFMNKEEACQSVGEILAALDITDLTHKLPNTISYGQQQRAAIARAIAFPSPVMLLDEPFKGLDTALVGHTIAFIREHQSATRQTIIFTTHQEDERKKLADCILYLSPCPSPQERGEITE